MLHPLPAVSDLYAALRASGTAPEALPALISGSDPETARRLLSVDQGLLRAILRAGEGLEAVEGAAALRQYLARLSPAPLFHPDVAIAPSALLLTNGERPDMPAFSDRAFDEWFAAQGVPYGIGIYGEDRRVYRSAQFADAASPERRTRHLGIDVFAPAGTAIYAPLTGVVRHAAYNADALDYGHTLILEHDGDGQPFFTLYGHLGASLPRLLQPGNRVQPGQLIAHLGDWPENGGWAPHVHFQIMATLLDQRGGNFFGVGQSSLWDIWQDICPDPNLILRLRAAQIAQ